LFVLPLLAAYELGVLIVPTTMRNGADAWMRRFLDVLGLGGYFLLPCLTVTVLVAWHYLLREPWQVRRRALVWMLGESIALAVVLMGVAHLQGLLLSMSATSRPMDVVGQVVAFCGAGLYEEVLFRLLLLPVAARAAALAGLRHRWKIAAAVVSTSLLFSLAHYIGAGGDTWEISSFLFRFLAGVFFALLFVTRGFGITAGTHAIYDVLVGVGG
jgi:membrane protease YdiL (CAAX protease family)